MNGYFLDGRPADYSRTNTRYGDFGENLMTKVLVTGAAGYIGTVLVERLLAANEFDVVALDSLCTGTTVRNRVFQPTI